MPLAAGFLGRIPWEAEKQLVLDNLSTIGDLVMVQTRQSVETSFALEAPRRLAGW
jgi:hypothetical protein